MGKNNYKTKLLISTNEDPNLVDPWNLIIKDDKIYNTNKKTVSIYSLAGKLIKTIQINNEKPIGIVFNECCDKLTIEKNNITGVCKFIVSTKKGNLYGYNEDVDEDNMILIRKRDKKQKNRGLATANKMFYLVDFKSNSIITYDCQMNIVPDIEFLDPCPTDYQHIYNITNLNGILYVSYTYKNKSKKIGKINSFDCNGNFICRVTNNLQMYAPYGMTLAPSCFRHFSKKLMTCDFDNGLVSGFELCDSKNKTNGVIMECNYPFTLIGISGLFAYKNKIYFNSCLEDCKKGVIGYIELK